MGSGSILRIARNDRQMKSMPLPGQSYELGGRFEWAVGVAANAGPAPHVAGLALSVERGSGLLGGAVQYALRGEGEAAGSTPAGIVVGVAEDNLVHVDVA